MNIEKFICLRKDTKVDEKIVFLAKISMCDSCVHIIGI